MKSARTVLGDVDARDLGVMMCHQHLLTDPDKSWRPDPDYAPNDPELAYEEVRDYVAAGGKTLVEMTAVGQRCDVTDFEWMSQKSGAHILITTGFSWEPSMPQFPREASSEEIAAMMVRELTEGIDGTDVRAGVIKAGSSPGRITEVEANVFRAAAMAQREVGAPISTHTTAASAFMLQIEAFEKAGADMTRVAIGHVDSRLQYGQLRMLARTGVYLIFDSIGKTKYGSDELRAQMFCDLAREGFLDQLLIAIDNGRRSYFLSYGGGPGLRYPITTFLAMLRERGMSDDEIHRVTVDNPARLYAF